MTIVTNYLALLSGYGWNIASSEPALTPKQPIFITYSFPTAIPAHVADAYRGAASTWQAFSESDKAVARDALRQWADASGIVFLEAKRDHGDIQFQWLDFNRVPGSAGFGGFAYYPTSRDAFDGTPQAYSDIGGDVFMNAALRQTSYASADARLDTFLHEVGHALGFKHSFETSPFNDSVLRTSLDTTAQTVMSYTGSGYATALGPLDRAAVAAVYGGPGTDGSHLASWRWSASAETLTLVGKSGNDRIFGTNVTDRIKAQAGNDRLCGLAGDDSLDGGAGIDTLAGGDGDDVLVGGLGRDSLDGGEGDDRFDYNSLADSAAGSTRDTVDFWSGDRIDLSTIDADTRGTGGNQAFTWIGGSAFSGGDGQLCFRNGLLQGDVNGDRRADFEIKILGFVGAGDIIL